MGIYLPPSVQTPLVIGAVMGYFLDRALRNRNLDEEATEEHKRRGTLFASGLIVGESIMGVLLAAIIVVSVSNGGSDTPLSIISEEFASGIMPELLGLIVFVLTIVCFCKIVTNKD